jgi:hypothetical protein
MKSIQIFDPAMCCNTGVCGVDVDQQLINFAADADWAKQNGAQIQRFNLAQQPMDFANNPVVILVDGEFALAGRYPNRVELARWTGITLPINEIKPAVGSGSKCC